MKINYKCLPCLVNQVVKVSEMTNVNNREDLFKEVFQYLGSLDFNKTNPEIIGETFKLIKKYAGNNDPYLEIRNYYNKLFLSMINEFERKIDASENSFEEAVKYAIIGNIVDFNPIHNSDIEDIMKLFEDIDKYNLAINHTERLMEDIRKSKSLLYLGDNCGEICLDKILLKKIKEYNPNIELFFGVRGEPVVNDSIEEDAYNVGIDQYAKIVSNGDGSLGTVLSRTNEAFGKIFSEADIIISKGQANYESLSDHIGKNIYFLLMVKCEVIAKDIGFKEKSVICLNTSQRLTNQ